MDRLLLFSDIEFVYSINEKSGEIKVQRSLNNLPVHVITIWVEARDKNAVKNVDDQFDKGKVIFVTTKFAYRNTG